MEKLTNKTYNNYDYTSRYTSIPYYYHTEDDKYIYGIGSQVNKDVTYVLHKVKNGDSLDYLSLKYYGNPTYYWYIAYFNDIQDCLIDITEKYNTLKIPNITGVQFN